MKSIIFFIAFKDGTGQISEHHLENELSFVKYEMIKWVKENYKEKGKPIKSIKEMSHK